MKKGKTESVGDILRKYLRQEGLETPLNQQRLISKWFELMGPGISAYTGEIYIKNQTLFVQLKSPALKNNLMIKILENRGEFLNERQTTLIDKRTRVCHDFLPEGKHVQVDVALYLQHGIPLLESFLIPCQSIQIRFVVLGNDQVHEPAAFFAAAQYKFLIIR